MIQILQGDWIDALREMADESVQCCVTSPPYWGLRDYGVQGQLGLERTPEEYVAKMVEGFREVRRVLRKDGTLWLNLGDSYSGGGWGGHEDNKSATGCTSARSVNAAYGMKPKDLVGIPWMVAFALRADGWYLRQDIIWSKPNPMPESVTDRCTKAHEYLFLLSKSERYYCDMEAIKEPSITNDIRRPYTSQGAWDMDGRPEEQRHGGEPRSFKGSQFNTGKTAEHQLGRASEKPRKTKVPGGWDTGAGGHVTIHRSGRTSAEYVETELGETRNKRSVWEIATCPFPEAHFATFPPKLVEPCILAGSKEGDTVLDPFNGAGTTGLVATRLQRNYIGIELNPEYVEMAKRRIEQDQPLFNEVTI